MNKMLVRCCVLTFEHVLSVSRILQDLGEAIQQHGSLTVAVRYVLRLFKHLIQSCRLNLTHIVQPLGMLATCFRWFRWWGHLSMFETHNLHCVVVDELFSSDAVDLVHKALLIWEEVVEFVRQVATEGDAAFVALVQTLDHWQNEETHFRLSLIWCCEVKHVTSSSC